MAKRFDPKAKARKQKILAAGLGVVLLGVLAFQGPTILGMFKGSSSTPATEPAPAAPTPAAPVTPAPPGAAASPTPAPAATAELVDSDPVPTPATGQLVTFDRFESKDPFVPQVDDGSGASGGPVAASPSNEGTPPLEVTNLAPVEAAPPAPAAYARTATISVNGVSSQVAVSATFPEGEPIFKLVSLTKTGAKVGIVDGAYATGSQTITLRKGGKPVTLMNTADGTTYVLRLLSVGSS